MLFPTFFDHYSKNSIQTDFEIVCEMGGNRVRDGSNRVRDRGIRVRDGVIVYEMGISCARWVFRVRDGFMNHTLIPWMLFELVPCTAVLRLPVL